MSEHNLFQEVQEDLDRQKLEALWKKYGLWVILAALGIVISTASSTGYRSWKENRAQKASDALFSALQTGEGSVERLEALDAVKALPGGQGVAVIGLLKSGFLALEQGEKDKALAVFDAIGADASVLPEFRHLAILASVRAQLDDGDAAQLSAKLEPLTQANGAWRFSAQETLGYLALRSKDNAKAKKIFSELSSDASAPRGIARRAADVLRTLN